MKLIAVNPANDVERPKKDKFIGNFYESAEISALFQHISGHSLELPIKLAAFYGLRRSEILELKWDAIDFNTSTISIRHTVTACNLEGKHIEVVANTTKNKSSTRTLPLVPAFHELLLQKKEEQAICRKLCGNAYCKDYLGYICVNELGERLKPNTLSAGFQTDSGRKRSENNPFSRSETQLCQPSACKRGFSETHPRMAWTQ